MTARPWYAYLIELEAPLGNRNHQAWFYLGIARDYLSRIANHRLGLGAKMLACAGDRRIRFDIIRLWEFPSYQEARAFEVWAKRSVKNHKRLLKLPATLAFQTIRVPVDPRPLTDNPLPTYHHG